MLGRAVTLTESEPILTDDDREVWEQWRETCLLHARTQAHRRRVDAAKQIVERALSTCSPWCVAWSGGKDSTALTHLVCVEMGRSVDAFAHKDDLDFPESEPYVVRLAAQWGVPLRVVRPPISPAAWMRDHARDHAEAGTLELHARTSELARAAWWDTIDAETHAYAGYFDGLCKHESRARLLNRALRGSLYVKAHRTRGAIFVAHPLHDWAPQDVYGYCFARGVELLQLYQCVALLHREEPWRLREEWWVPSDKAARHGQVAWLARYYPSLYRQLRAWMPDAAQLR